MSGEGLELHATAQDVGQAAEELDAKYEGTELTVAFNPEYLLDGVEAATGDEVTLETIDALKPALLRSHRQHRLPLPADARPGAAERPCTSQRLWLTDFRSYRAAELSFAPGLTAVVGANGEGKTNLLEAIGYLATLSSFRGAPPDALVRDGARPGGRAGRGRARRPRPAGRGRAHRTGPQPGAGQPPAPGPGPRPARRAAGHGVLARRPRPGEGRARPGAGASSTTRWSPPGRRTTPCAATSTGCCASATRCCKQAGGRLDGRASRSTLDVWDAKLVAGRRGAGRGPGGAGRAARAPSWSRPTTAWPSARRR